MKQWFFVFAVMCLILPVLLTACGGDKADETPTSTTTTTPAISPTIEPTVTPGTTSTSMPFTTIVADSWLKVSDSPKCLPEGLAFDREGNLYYVDVFSSGKVFKVTTADKKISTVYDGGKGSFSSVDIHKDGRMFLCSVTSGKIIAVNPDGTGATEILTGYNGGKISPADLIFDSKGNFYFTDYQGSTASPTGRVFRVSADLKTVDLVADGLARPAGISLSPDENTLWIGEYDQRTLAELDLRDDGVTLPSEIKRIYQYPGTGFPEFNAVDEQGNIYQALVGDGKIDVVNEEGVALAEILTPGRVEGKQLNVINLTFQPGTDQAFITAGSGDGAYILTFKGLAKGLPPFSHQ